MKERGKKTRQPRIFHFHRNIMILGIVDNHNMTIVIIRDSFSPGRYVLYCKSLLFTGFDIFSSRNCERTQQRQHRLDLELIIRIKASQSLTKPPLSFTEKSRIKIGHFLTEHNTKSESEGCSVQSKQCFRDSLRSCTKR